MKHSILLMILSGAALTGICRADALYTVTADTAPLVGNSNAPFALDFQLTSGDTTSDVRNSAILSQFNFGAGGSAGSGSPFANSGDTSGSLNSSVTLSTLTGVFFNEFSEFFTPGNTLTFQLDLTNNGQPSGTPDEFTFQLIDKTNAEVSTTDPSGSNSLLVIDLTGSALSPLIYTTSGDGISVTPQVSSATSAVPEPSAAWLLPSGAAFLFLVRRIRRMN